MKRKLKLIMSNNKEHIIDVDDFKLTKIGIKFVPNDDEVYPKGKEVELPVSRYKKWDLVKDFNKEN